jgi:hypothetical protein
VYIYHVVRNKEHSDLERVFHYSYNFANDSVYNLLPKQRKVEWRKLIFELSSVMFRHSMVMGVCVISIYFVLDAYS